MVLRPYTDDDHEEAVLAHRLQQEGEVLLRSLTKVMKVLQYQASQGS
jgi:hypothetical protein